MFRHRVTVFSVIAYFLCAPAAAAVTSPAPAGDPHDDSVLRAHDEYARDRLAHAEDERVIAWQSAPMSRAKDIPGAQTSLTNVVAQAWDERLRASRHPVDLTFVTPADIHADLPVTPTAGEPAGAITAGEARAVVPKGTQLHVTNLTGAQIRRVLEEQWTGDSADQIVPELGISGLEYTFDPTRPAGSRVRAVTVDGYRLQERHTYRVATSGMPHKPSSPYPTLRHAPHAPICFGQMSLLKWNC